MFDDKRRVPQAMPNGVPGPVELMNAVSEEAPAATPERRWQLMEYVAHYQKLFMLAEHLLETTCNHIVKEKEKDKWGSYGSAYCAGCGLHLGWYCPESKDRYCHYNEDEDPIHDHCLCCGDPEERK